MSIAAANFPGEKFAAAIIGCVIVQAIVCSLYVRWQRRATGRGRARAGEM